jgi:hypothetical protein
MVRVNRIAPYRRFRSPFGGGPSIGPAIWGGLPRSRKPAMDRR